MPLPLSFIRSDNSPLSGMEGHNEGVGNFVVSEQSFSQSSRVGSSILASREDHSHGTPNPRHPQTGSPYVMFSNFAELRLGRRAGEFEFSALGTADNGNHLRTWMTTAVGAYGWGRGAIDMGGWNDGSVLIKIYNDLDVNNNYGLTGASGKPLLLDVEGRVICNGGGSVSTWGVALKTRLENSGLLVGGTENDVYWGAVIGDANATYKNLSENAVTAARRTSITAPVATNGWGRGVIELSSFNDGSAQALCYNDLDLNGVYGPTGGTGRSFSFKINGGDLNSLTYYSAVLWVYTAGPRVGLTLHAGDGGVANQVRVQTDINGFLFKNYNDSGYVPLLASEFLVNSARESKANIRAIEEPSTAKILGLTPCLFDRPGLIKVDGKRAAPVTHRGLVAEDVVEHIPEAVTWHEGKPHALDYSAILVTLVKTVQELVQRCDATDNRRTEELASLKSELLALSSAVKKETK